MLVVFALIDSQFNGFKDREFSCLGERVAPRVGAWIETKRYRLIACALIAPRVGAWIETRKWTSLQREIDRAPRGRVD